VAAAVGKGLLHWNDFQQQLKKIAIKGLPGYLLAA
jgi:hypothetical protein